MGGDRPKLERDLTGRSVNRAATERDAAAAPGPDGIRRRLGVAVPDANVLGRHAERIGSDLRKRSFVALAVVLHPGFDQHSAVGHHIDPRRFVAGFDRHPAAREVGGAVCGLLDKAGDAHPDTPFKRRAQALCLGQIGREQVACSLDRQGIGAFIVGEAERVLVRECADDVLEPKLDRVNTKLRGDVVHESLLGEDDGGPVDAAIGADRALVGGDSAERCLVRLQNHRDRASPWPPCPDRCRR